MNPFNENNNTSDEAGYDGQQNMFGEEERRVPRYNYSWNNSEIPYARPPKKKGNIVLKAMAIIVGIAVFATAVGLIGYGGYSIYRDYAAPGTQPPFGGNPANPSHDPNLPELPITIVQGYGKANDPTVRDGEPLTGVQIVKKVKPSVVGIVSKVTRNGFWGQSSGSGIIMTSDGYIITNQHVINSASEVSVVFGDGTEYAAVIVGQDAKSDLAVLKIDAQNLEAAEFGDSTALEEGEPVIAIGNPMGLELFGSSTSGIVSAVNREITIEDRVLTLIQTDAAINSGNSGGPLINQYGQVVGINSIKIGSSDVEGLGFAIPIHQAKPIVDNLIQYGYVRERPVIGVNGANMDERTSRLYDVPMGVYVDSVTPGSGAHNAGIKSGDIIIKVNGKVITTMDELNIEKSNFKSGETITLTVYRDGKTIDMKVVLSKRCRDNRNIKGKRGMRQ